MDGGDMMFRRIKETIAAFRTNNTPARPLRLYVKMIPGEDPRVYDLDTGSEVTDRIGEIRIKPGRRSTTMVFEHNGAGHRFIRKRFRFFGEHVVAKYEAPVLSIQGMWRAVAK